MFGIRYLKVAPTTYVLHYKTGKLKQEGPGLAFFYFAPTSEIVLVPLESTDVPFLFNEVTADFQDATIQGQLTYRIIDAKRVAEVLNFSVDERARYRSEDPQRLASGSRRRLRSPPAASRSSGRSGKCSFLPTASSTK